MTAAYRGHLPILRALLDRKDIVLDAVNTEHGYTAFHQACFMGTAFHLACFMGHADCAVELARRGCDTTLRAKNGATGLDIAKLYERTTVLERLRTYVLEQLRQSRDSGSAATDAVLALTTVFLLAEQHASQAWREDMRELLEGGGASAVDRRVEVMETKTGNKMQTTALIQAVSFNQHAVVELLLEYNANLNLASGCGTTP